MRFQLDDDKRLCNGPVSQSVEVDDEDDEKEEEAEEVYQDDEKDQAEVEFAGEDKGWMDHYIVYL